MTPEKLLYAKTHEWVQIGRGDQGEQLATVGISDFAVQALTDLVYIELPKVGHRVTAGEAFGEIESVKAVSDLYSPLTGEVVAVNQDLPGHLEILNEDPFGAGWMIKLKVADEAGLSSLLDYSAYRKQCAEEGH